MFAIWISLTVDQATSRLCLSIVCRDNRRLQGGTECSRFTTDSTRSLIQFFNWRTLKVLVGSDEGLFRKTSYFQGRQCCSRGDLRSDLLQPLSWKFEANSHFANHLVEYPTSMACQNLTLAFRCTWQVGNFQTSFHDAHHSNSPWVVHHCILQFLLRCFSSLGSQSSCWFVPVN